MCLPYTYKITHIPSGKWYYGVRFARGCHPSDLWVKYFTSSNIIKQLIRQDGKGSFKSEVRKIFNTKEQAISYEHRVLRRIIRFKNCLNKNAWPAVSPESNEKSIKTNRTPNKDGLTPSQIGGLKWKQKRDTIDIETGLTFRELRRKRLNETLDENGTRYKTEEQKKTCSFVTNNPSKNPETMEKIKKILKDGYADGTYKTIKGQKFPSISEKLKGRTDLKNKIWINDGVKNNRITEGTDIPNGFVLGRLHVKKGWNYDKVTCPHCGLEGSGGNMKRYHFENCLQRKPNVL